MTKKMLARRHGKKSFVIIRKEAGKIHYQVDSDWRELYRTNDHSVADPKKSVSKYRKNFASDAKHSRSKNR